MSDKYFNKIYDDPNSFAEDGSPLLILRKIGHNFEWLETWSEEFFESEDYRDEEGKWIERRKIDKNGNPVVIVIKRLQPVDYFYHSKLTCNPIKDIQKKHKHLLN